MPLPEFLRESVFEQELFDFASRPCDLHEVQLESAMHLLEGLRPLEDKMLGIILAASIFMNYENYDPSSFMTKIRSELQRRVAFIEEVSQHMRTNFAEKIAAIEHERAERRKAGSPAVH